MYFKALTLVLGVLALSEPCQADWKALSALEHDGAQVSASAVDLGAGAAVAGLNANRRLTPASLTKLITAAAMLQQWPADRMLRTTLLTSGPVSAGVLRGDLVLLSAGDPSLDDHSLWTLAAQLKSYDIHTISGGLTLNLAPFGALACGTVDRCQAQHQSDKAFNAPVSALGVDFGNWCVMVRPTAPGDDAQVHGCGVAHLPIPVSGTVKTGPAGSRVSLMVERDTTSAGDALKVGGSIPMGDDQRVWRAMSDPARGAGLLFTETLREMGIVVAGPLSITTQPPAGQSPQDPMRELAAVEGLTLREQLGRMLRFSNNYIADVLTMDLAASSSGAVAPRDLAIGAQALSQFMTRVTPVDASARLGYELYSGSGLTVENRLSANDLAGVLAYQYRNTGHFPAFYGGLTVPREAPFDFMRHGNDAWLDRVALKTGTLNDPVSVCGAAGYLRKRDGGWIAFAAIVNGSPARSHIPLETAMQAIQSDIEDILARE
jgi:serine-type D-Ala-D-Ala carboxypeptidase/endopeptidase (penicillin-binding protein 4)